MSKKTAAAPSRDLVSEQRKEVSRANLKLIFGTEGFQADVARRSNVPPTTISRWLKDGVDDTRGTSFERAIKAAGYVPESVWEDEPRRLPELTPDTNLTHEITGVVDVPDESVLATLHRKRLHEVLDRLLKNDEKAKAVTLLLDGLEKT